MTCDVSCYTAWTTCNKYLLPGPGKLKSMKCLSGECLLIYCGQVQTVIVSGIREAEINVAEGKKRSRILNSEGFKSEQINEALG